VERGLEGAVSGILDTATTIVLFLAILVVLVVLHELGHFVTARLSGVRVLEFGIGFPPRARRLGSDGETEYTLNWLPLGGFVRLEGEDGDSDDPRSFTRQPLLKRTVILASGVVMNLLLAAVIFAVIAAALEPVALAKVDSVVADSPAQSIGLVAGDVITKVDGRSFPYFDGTTPTSYMRERPGQQVTLTVARAGGRVDELPVTLRGAADVTAGKGALGITVRFEFGDTVSRDPVTALRLGVSRTVEACGLVLGALRDLVGAIVTDPAAAPPVSGPIGIAQAVGTVRTQAPPVVLLWLIGILSANLAIVNILPFPPLDGGRIAVGVIQAVTRNRISVNVERATYLVGFAVLFAFLIWVSWFDIIRGTPGT
jgi:regulator of sigma E protease